MEAIHSFLIGMWGGGRAEVGLTIALWVCLLHLILWVYKETLFGPFQFTYDELKSLPGNQQGNFVNWKKIVFF